MRQPIIACFSQPTKPISSWVSLLKSFKINSVFLNSQNLDPKFLSELSQNKIKVFLEFGVFSNDPFLWKRIPQARVVGGKEKVLTTLAFGRKTICPNNQRVRKIKLENLDKITKRFCFDSVFLDGLRFPSAWEGRKPEKRQTCFCQNCRESFARFLGITSPKNASPDWPLRLYPQEWYQWRTNTLTGFLKEAKIIIAKNSPRTKLGVFVVPFTKKEFDNSIIKIFGQDVAALSKYADIISPMLYHQMCRQEVSWIAERTRYFSRLTKKPILPAIQTRDMPENLPNRISEEELKMSIKLALSPPSKGVILFTLDNALAVFPSDKIRQILKDVRIK